MRRRFITVGVRSVSIYSQGHDDTLLRDCDRKLYYSIIWWKSSLSNIWHLGKLHVQTQRTRDSFSHLTKFSFLYHYLDSCCGAIIYMISAGSIATPSPKIKLGRLFTLIVPAFFPGAFVHSLLVALNVCTQSAALGAAAPDGR